MIDTTGKGLTLITNQLSYPPAHWAELSRFAQGDELDPKGLFRLAEDTWDAWPYAERGTPSNAETYRYRFSHLESFLKLYVKLYCYDELIGRGGTLKTGAPFFPYRLTPADRQILLLGLQSIDDLAIHSNFKSIWKALLRVGTDSERERLDKLTGDVDTFLPPRSAVLLQTQTLPFWRFLSIRFGAPLHVLPVTPHRKRIPFEVGSDESKLIPPAVIRQLGNLLALHRDGIAPLNRFHHLRLCVLLLHIALGRRIEEILSAPRCAGPDGPLEHFPCRHEDGEATEALWFKFHPSKDGPAEFVHISSEFENLVIYCVRELLRYSDEVREFAVPEERDHLILVSTWNMTQGYFMNSAPPLQDVFDFTRKGGAAKGTQKRRRIGGKTTALTYGSLRTWLSGKKLTKSTDKSWKGFMEAYHITATGLADEPIYKLDTHQARHTRQSIIARDSSISDVTKQRDLNHRDPNMQFAYQHVLNEKNDELLSLVTESPLRGHDLQFLNEILRIQIQNRHSQDDEGISNYELGLVTILTPRLRKLIEINPAFFEKNLVELGYCAEPEPCDTYKRAEEETEKDGDKKTSVPRMRNNARVIENVNHRISAETFSQDAPSQTHSSSNDVVSRLNRRMEQLKKEGP